MQQKYKKVLVVFAIIANVLGWISLAGAMLVTGDLSIIAIIAIIVSFLIAFPLLLSIISSKLMLREKTN